MVAKSGDPLLADDAVAAIRDRLIPLAEVITPNLPEAATLLGAPEPSDLAGMRTMARELMRLGPASVLLKGGHLDGPDSIDVFCDGETLQEFSAPRIATKNTHGTGCTLSSAIAALLPRYPRAAAVRRAKAYVTGAIAAADRLEVGTGHGPLHHSFQTAATLPLSRSDRISSGESRTRRGFRGRAGRPAAPGGRSSPASRSSSPPARRPSPCRPSDARRW